MEPHGAQHAARDGEGHSQLRELGTREDGSARRRLLRRHRARRGGGHISEGSGQNVSSWCATAIIYTPSLGSSILGGITRDCIVTLAYADMG